MSYYSKTDDISYTPLSLEEEAELFKAYYKNNGKKARAARDEIIRRHLKLAAKLAIRLAKRTLDDETAISAGNYGLMQSLKNKNFRCERGARFSTYLRSYVRGAVFAEMATLRSTTSYLVVVVEPYKRNLPCEAAITGVSLDDNASLVEGATTDHSSEAEDLQNFRKRMIAKSLRNLNKLEAASVRLVSLGGQTYDAMAAKYGVSRQACQQAHVKALKKLKIRLTPLRSELL